MITSDKNKSFTLWPYAIIVCMVLFMSYIAMFVYKAMNQDVDLVSSNYYEQEIQYQDHINMVGRTKAVGDVSIKYNTEAENVLLQLPESFQGQRVSGKVVLFRPSEDQLDQELPLQLGRDMSQLIETAHLAKGLWKVRVSFSANNETYFTEQSINIAKP